MEGRIRTSGTETPRPDRDGAASLSSRNDFEALQAALERIAVLERRELALRAALVGAGLDPDSILTRLELAPKARTPAPEVVAAQTPHILPPRENPTGDALADTGEGNDEVGDVRAPHLLPLDGLATVAARSLARRLADEAIGGPVTLRLRAAQRLVEIAGPAASAALLVAVEEAAGPIRAALLEQLGKSGDKASLDVIVGRYLDDEAAEVRAAAVESGVRFAEGTALLGILGKGLGDEDSRVRRRTVLACAAARGIDPGMLLVPLLKDADRQVRRVACSALATTREPLAALALIGALLDEDTSVRQAAGQAAERLFGEPAKGIAALPPRHRTHAVARLRSHVASNLTKLAPGGKLEPSQMAPVVAAAEEEVAAAVAAREVLEDLLSTGHPGAGFEDDVAGWTEENDPDLQASFARLAGGWSPWSEEWDSGLEDEAEALYREAGEAGVPGLVEAEPSAPGTSDVRARIEAAVSAAFGEELDEAAEWDDEAEDWIEDDDELLGEGDEAYEVRDEDVEVAEAVVVEPVAAEAAAELAAAELAAAELAAAEAAAAEQAAAEQAAAERAAAERAAADLAAAELAAAELAAAELAAAELAAAELAAAELAAAELAAAELVAAELAAAEQAAAELAAAELAAAEAAAAELAAAELAAAELAAAELAAAELAAAELAAAELAAAEEAAAIELERSRVASVLAARIETLEEEPVSAPEPPIEAAAPQAEPTVDEEEPAYDETAGDDSAFAAIEQVLLAAIRGCTDDDLMDELGWSEAELAAVVQVNLEAGRLVRRGRKLFLP